MLTWVRHDDVTRRTGLNPQFRRRSADVHQDADDRFVDPAIAMTSLVPCPLFRCERLPLVAVFRSKVCIKTFFDLATHLSITVVVVKEGVHQRPSFRVAHHQCAGCLVCERLPVETGSPLGGSGLRSVCQTTALVFSQASFHPHWLGCVLFRPVLLV